MEEGIEIPIGADFSAMQAAFDRVIEAINKMGDKIAAAMEKSSAAAMKTTGSMEKLAVGSNKAGQATDQLEKKATGTGSKLMTVARGALAAGTMVGNLSAGLGHVASVMTALSSNNFGTMLTNVTRIGKGLKSAMSSVWSALTQLGTNNSLLKIATGAAAGVAGVLLLRQAFRTVIGSINLLKNSVTSVFQGMISAAKATARGIGNAFKSVASAPGKLLSLPGLPLAGILSAAGAVALLTTQIRGASREAASFEDMRVSVEHFTGSVQSAKSLLSDLETFSIKTPFETKTVQMTAKGLLGAGIREDVAGITKDLGAISGTGQELMDLGDALGKGFAKGKFQTEEMNKFLERGINLVPALQTAVGKTGDAFTKALEKGLSFSQVTTAIRSMSAAGGQFFGLLEKRSTTFNGLISTLSSAWTNLRKAFAEPINDALKPILQAGIDNITSLMDKAKALGTKVAEAISIVFTAFGDGKQMELFRAGLAVAFHGAMDILARGLRGAVAFLATALPPVFETVWAKLSDMSFWEGVSLLLQSAAAAFGSEINKALGRDSLAESQDRQSEMQGKHGAMLIARSGLPNSGAVIAKAMGDALAAAREAAKGPNSDALSSAIQALQSILGKLKASASADKIFRELLAPKTGTGTAIPKTPSSLSETVTKAAQPAVMSLTRVGGGGFAKAVANNQLSEARKQTGVLQKILKAVDTPKPTMGAVYS